jgi:serine/threonine-protein kinase
MNRNITKILHLTASAIAALSLTTAGNVTQAQTSLQTESNQTVAQANPVVHCLVVGIQRGQLAVRRSPNGEAIAGLNNDNLVRFIRYQDIWYYIRVVRGPNQRVNGIEGWVNSQYLECAWD